MLLVTHIPPGCAVSSWWDREGPIRAEDGPFSYVDRFNNLFSELAVKHKDVIISMMGGHHHNDYFHLFYQNGKNFHITPICTYDA